jgi:DNA-damage-inducible protein D
MTQQTPDFDSIKQINPYGTEYWSARDLAPLLGHAHWRRFEDAIKRAKIACKTHGTSTADHFVGAGKMVGIGSGSQREVKEETTW